MTKKRLNDIARKWAAALRSGEYSQTMNTLWRGPEDKRGYCCLGVLCIVTEEEMAPLRSLSGQFFSESNANNPTGEHHPNATRAYRILERYIPTAFTMMNDDDGLTFAQIADYIDGAVERLNHEVADGVVI